MAELITQSEYAKRLNVTPPRINALIKKGIIKLKKDKIDPEQADEAIENYTDPMRRKAKTDTGVISENSFIKARTIRENYKAALSKLEYEEKIGKLIEVEKVKNIFFNKARIVRDNLLNIPDRVAMRLINKKDTDEIKQILEKEIRQVLEELSDNGIK